MRIAITVAMVLALAACSRPGGQFLAGAGGSSTTVSGLADTEAISEDAETQQELAVTTTTVGAHSTPTTEVETSPVTTVATVAPASQAPTTTTSAVLTVDPQEVESALAELDALLSSLGSAMSAMEQAFEQGE
jgi:hypothetical protein